ncbi:MAG: RNB domain-containing ribonuclease, partial [Holosporales bacterium]
FLKGCDIILPKGQIMRPKNFNHILGKAKDTPFEAAVNDLVLRTQAQAVYSPENIGHFGLSLSQYAHFTSPIRRYADLLVHRALIKALKLDTESDFHYSQQGFEEMAQHISQTERQAAAAERETIARYVSAYLATHVGETFTARVTGVASFGLFVRILDNGAEGLIPMRLLGTDYFVFDEAHQRLVGRRTKKVYALGDRLEVILQQADVLTGGLQFAPAPTSEAPHKPQKTHKNKGRKRR